MKQPIYFCTDIETSGQCFATGSIMTLAMVPVMLCTNTFAHTYIPINELYIHMYGRRTDAHHIAMDDETIEWWAKQDDDVYQEAFAVEPRLHCGVATQHVFDFIEQVTTEHNGIPVFVSAPIGFDYQFVANYFRLYLGKNPFGSPGKTLDPKSYFAGMSKRSILQCGKKEFKKEFKEVMQEDIEPEKRHHALFDAKRLAKMLCVMLTANDEELA